LLLAWVVVRLLQQQQKDGLAVHYACRGVPNKP
jgi:hypothetical protein